MANVDGGSLSFTSELDNSQLDAAIDETLRRVQGLSDGIVDVGDSIDATTRAIVDSIDQSRQNISELEDTVSSLDAQISAMQPGDAQTALMEQAQAAKAELENERKGLVGIVSALNNLQSANEMAAASGEQIRTMLAQIGVVCNQEEANLESLEAQFSQLGVEMNKALTDGQTEVAKAIQSRKNAIEGEIRVRRKLLTELRNQSDALEEQAEKLEQHRKKTEDNANAQVTLRQRIKDVKKQMADLIANGVSEQSAAYKELVNELGRLQDIQGDIATQGKIMANDENQFAGLTSGLQGVVGGFTAASSAMALFAGENENLQAAMLKVQQLMSIIMGLQQVSQTLNKDSAFQLVTLNGLREWWNKLLAVGRGEQVAETAAVAADTVAETANTAAVEANTVAQTKNAAAKNAAKAATAGNTAATGANTVAQKAQNVAAATGTVANIGLAGAFRMVGAAIKSIPVFGWIIAGISALIGLYSHFSSKAAEAKKAQEEFSKSMVENCYKPIGIVNELSGKWAELGDNLEAKKKFIEENKDAFNQLGVAVNGVTDAENILVANKDAFINAQIEKAKAMTYVQMAMQKQKEYLEKIEERDKENSNGSVILRIRGGLPTFVDLWKEKNAEAQKLRKESEEYFAQARDTEKKGFEIMKEAGIDGAKAYEDVTLGAIEHAIQLKQQALKDAQDNTKYKEILAEIADLQKQADAITGKTTTTTHTTQTVKKDPFLEQLNKRKNEYARFIKWINSGDEVLIKSARQEFSGLLKEGATYIDYLRKQRDTILSIDVAKRTKEQNKQLRQLNDAIAEETKQTVLEAFNKELSEQLTNAESVMEMLNIIEKRRKELEQQINDQKDDADKPKKPDESATDYTNLQEAYQTYQDSLVAIQRDYNERRRLAMLNGEQSTLDALSREEEKRLVELQRKFLNLNVDWTQIFGGIDDAALSVLERLNGKINEALSINPNINGEGVDNLRQSLTALSTEIQDNDPFTVLGMAYNALAKQLQLNSLLESDDAFVEQLRAKKAEYEQFTKVIESGDATLIAGVNQMFPGLMESGKTYLDYLIGQKQKLSEQVSLGIDVGNSIEIIDAFIQQMQTGKTQSELMRDALKGTFDDVSTTLYAINQSFGNISSDLKEMGISMDEQTESVLNNLSLIVNQANQALSGIDANSLSLDNVSNLVDMLGKIQSVQFAATAEMNDVQKQMWEALQSAQRDAEKQTQAQVKSLLEEYGSYVAKKRKLEEEFNRDITLLTQARINATTDAERAELDAAIANRRRKFEKDNESSGDEDYDELKKTYKNYQQQITDIQKEYAEKRRIATEHNDQMLLAQLAQEEQEKLSEVQKNLLENSVDWQKLFGNLDELSTSTIKELIQKIEQQKIQFSASFSPDDLKAINEQLEKARQEIESRNPFTALSSAYSRLRKQLKENKLLDDNDPFIQQLRAKEKEYEQYKKTIETGDETLISGINQMFPGLMDDGRTFLEYLNNLKKQLEGRIDVDVNAQSSIEKIDALINQLESGKNSADALREALKDTFSSVAGTIDLVKGTFDSVVSGMDKMGIKFDEETQTILNDIGGIMDGASQLATGIASGNPLSIIQGSIGLLSSAFDLFNSRDRKAEQSIKRHQRNIEELQNAYTQLEWAINKALGGEVYKNQQAAIRNMKQQQSELYGMIRDENSKKHTDASKISEYQEQIAALGRQIEDMYAEIAKDILQTDAKSFADSLGDALVDAFSKGENAAQAFNKTVNEILKNAVVNQLKKRFLEQQLQSALDQLQNQMGYWRGDDFIFDGLSESEIEAFRAKVQSAANNYNQALEMYKDLFKDLNLDNEDESSLSGAVKGVSEETAGIISGQMNAIRINQIEATNILRQQLQSLNTIAQNTAFNRNLVKIDRIISLLERAYESDSLRSQGLGV